MSGGPAAGALTAPGPAATAAATRSAATGRGVRRRSGAAPARGLARLRPGVASRSSWRSRSPGWRSPTRCRWRSCSPSLWSRSGRAARSARRFPYLRVALYVGVFLALLNPLFSRGGLDVLWQTTSGLSPSRSPSRASCSASTTALRLAVVVLAFALFNVVLDPDDQLGLLSRLSFRSGPRALAGHAALPGVLARRGAHRRRPALARRGARPRAAARARRRPRLPLLAALLTRSLERAVDVAASMEARGYGSGEPHALDAPAPLAAADVATAVAAGARRRWPCSAASRAAPSPTTSSRCSTTPGRD